jgi:hypothetical protein
MTAAFLRDAAATAAIFGFFASAWVRLGPGRAAAGMAQGARRGLDPVAADRGRWWRHDLAELVGPDGVRRRHQPDLRSVVGIEVALAAIGARSWARRRSSELIPAWVALVVGVHLIPVALLVRSPLIAVTGVLVTLVALVAVPLARSRPVAVSAVTGLGAGTVLLAAALWSLASALLWP